MKTLEVTDEQYAFIQHLREEISAQVVGKYGYVRERDAVQFLIDNLDGDLEVAVDGAGEPTATDDVAASVAAELDDRRAVTFDEEAAGVGETDDPESGDDRALEDEDEPADESDADDGGEGDESEIRDGDDEGGDTAADEGDAGDEAGGSERNAEDDGDDADENDADEDGAATDDDMLNRMMNLLDTHDDKWEESPSADYRYRVTLPDGTTEDVQTKDDVRALLFKHY